MAQELFVGGLPFNTTSDGWRELFSQVDGVESVSVATDRDTGRSRGFGFVEMATAEAAADAIRKFDGYQLDGRSLKVEVSKPSAPRSGGGRRSGAGRGRW